MVLDGVKLHYLDEGEGPVIWLMHGNTSWSYLYRKMIPPLVAAGYRCFVPDLMGFGLSDIPHEESAYSLQRHVALMTALVEHLDLRDMVVVGQDWGGPVVLRYAIAHRHNVRALVLLNTFIERFAASRAEQRRLDIITGPLPPGFDFLFKGGARSHWLIKRLDLFRRFVWMGWRNGNHSRLGAGFRRAVDPRAMDEYRAIHAHPENRAGLAVFPGLIPNRADHPNAEYINEIRRVLGEWEVPVQVIWADGDLAWSLDQGERIARWVPDGEFYRVRNAGHFVQEDAGEEVAQQMIGFLQRRLARAALNSGAEDDGCR